MKTLEIDPSFVDYVKNQRSKSVSELLSSFSRRMSIPERIALEDLLIAYDQMLGIIDSLPEKTTKQL